MKVICNILAVIFCFSVFAQKEYKDFNTEVLNEAIKQNLISKNSDSKNIFTNQTEVDSLSNLEFNKLLNKGVNDIIYFKVDFVGMFRYSKKIINGKEVIYSENSPQDAYFIYLENNNIYVKELIGKEFQLVEKNNLINPFSFKVEELDQETFVGTILRYRIANDKINLVHTSTNHQPVYTLIYFQNNNIIKHYFESEYLTNQESIFYNYNRKLKLYDFFESVFDLVKEGNFKQ